jgi:hypothetical protein
MFKQKEVPATNGLASSISVDKLPNVRASSAVATFVPSDTAKPVHVSELQLEACLKPLGEHD